MATSLRPTFGERNAQQVLQFLVQELTKAPDNKVQLDCDATAAYDRNIAVLLNRLMTGKAYQPQFTVDQASYDKLYQLSMDKNVLNVLTNETQKSLNELVQQNYARSSGPGAGASG